MIIVDKKLKERQDKSNPIRVGIVGLGAMGLGLLNQIQNHTPGMSVIGIYNRSVERARIDLLNINKGDRSFADIDNSREKTNGQNIFITDNIDALVSREEIDVIVEMTGSVEFGLDVVLSAFEASKHVLSFNAELEATFGPYLRKKASDLGVRYSLGDGDQPGVTLNLWRYVKMMGFTPLVCGNIKGMIDHYRNPDTQRNFAKEWKQSTNMVTSFADGTKISFEQACIANATNMTISKRGMRGLESKDHVENLSQHFNVDELISVGGVVDYIVGAKPGPGVFIYATTKDPISIRYMEYGKLGKGPLYTFYVPYHLLFFDLASSIARLIDFNDVTLDAEFGYKVEVIAVAKRNLSQGETIDGIGGFHVYGTCEKSDIVADQNLIPMGVIEGCKLKHDIPKDQAITYDNVALPPNRRCDNILEYIKANIK